ncbi:MAG: hypothetical protein PHI73_01355 [Patescibacteria group bacterium]|nr:hypothetical protein [Patescibacteria group bacterium]
MRYGLAFAVCAFFCVLAVQPISAQSIVPYRFTVEASQLDRYLGSEQVGTIKNGGFRFYVDSPDRTRLLALEYSNADNRVSPVYGLELDEESLDFGVCAPLAPVQLKLAGSIARYLLGEDYWAFGLYPSYERKNFALGFSAERDADETVHLDGTARVQHGNLGLYLGASNEKAVSHAGPIEEKRYISVLDWQASAPRILALAGSAVNQEDSPTWIGGIARYADVENRGANPAALFVMRKKPEATCYLGIATLWGRALNQPVSSAIANSFAHGALSRSRVVRNRDFGTLGVGRGYDAVDFGLVTATFTTVDIEAGMEAELRESQYALYGTWPRVFGPVHNPYLGLVYQTATDLVPGSRPRTLDDPGQDWKAITLGCKIHVTNTPDPMQRKKVDYLRLETSFRFDETAQGIYASATIWQ